MLNDPNVRLTSRCVAACGAGAMEEATNEP